MSDHKDYLISKRDSSNTSPYLKFTQSYDERRDNVFLFCESREDSHFYGTLLPKVPFNRPYRFITCNGKDGVLRTRVQLRRRVSHDIRRVAYLIDADHDPFVKRDLPPLDGVFITSCYSIENYLVSELVFTRIIAQSTGLQADDPALKTALNFYQVCMKQFVEHMRMVMATVIILKRDVGSLHMKEVCFQYVRLTNGKLRAIDDFVAHAYSQAGVTASKSSRHRAARLEKSLSKRSPATWLRGKYHGAWKAEIFKAIVSKLTGQEDMNGDPIRFSLRLDSCSQLIALGTPHLDCPADFRRFIDSWFA